LLPREVLPLTKRKLLRIEKQAQENGLVESTIILLKSMKKLELRLQITKSSSVKLHDDYYLNKRFLFPHSSFIILK
jgi:hypothetical protein